MHSLPKPETDFSMLFTSCARRKTAPEGEYLLSKLPIIDEAATAYDTKAPSTELHELHPISPANLHPVTSDSLKGLYNSHMVSKSGQARSEYDKMLAEAKKTRCCFCSYEDPTELDHFLPKSIFPEFSILPINLVPSCHRCNKLKASDAPISAANSYVHPYYEEYKNLTWLEAMIDFDTYNSPVVTYMASRTLRVENPDLAARIDFQITRLNLNMRYSSQASEELSWIEGRLRSLMETAGPEQLELHLIQEAESRLRANRNSWQAALYTCISSNERFLSMDWSI